MPSSLTGLLITILIFIPGYVHYVLRKRRFPTRRLSRTMEAAGLIVVAAVANTTILVFYGVVRLIPLVSDHSPSLSHLIRDPNAYILLDDSRLLYVTAWLIGLLSSASILSALAHKLWPLSYLSPVLAPAFAETSGWYYAFEANVPKNLSVRFVICELHDGSYISGNLAWFNTDPDDNPNRDIILDKPLAIFDTEGNLSEVRMRFIA